MRAGASRVVGILGEVMITVGVLLGLFVVWQLWWTDVIADQEHSDIIAASEDMWGRPPQKIAPPESGPPPVAKPGAENQVWGTLHIPKFDKVSSPIAEGTSMTEVLNVKGNGHYRETAVPGENGNFSIAGHRSTYGRPLHDIARLKEGDPVIVETAEAFYVYRVTSDQITMPSAIEVIAPVPNKPGEEPTEQFMTMTACHPMYSARERYIVHAKFDHWVDRKKGIPQELEGKVF
ncbi:class E sortase [Helcobacillus sp. ACRRO]|uniref:class E sortase n=1 Tax=Helcobacillus sp. ACRRO TaxID=2918202 RepID=UPI001EF4FF78|nr:class E sortase [Helcobacillus sp. ACRRO]MCG7427002.1 class E sortase [Helcobacillus sp. ACRRO]